MFYGLDAWLPNHGGSPSAFLGVTRTNAAEQLAGLNLDLRGKTPRQRVMLAAQASADTGQADGRIIYALSTQAWTDLYFELSQANALTMTKAPAASIGGISTGVIIALSRAIGETAPLIVIGAGDRPEKDMQAARLSVSVEGDRLVSTVVF